MRERIARGIKVSPDSHGEQNRLCYEKRERKRTGNQKGKEPSKNPRAKPREHIGKMAELYRKEKLGWGWGMKPRSWTV